MGFGTGLRKEAVMPTKTWVLWESEYPEEGSFLIEAETLEQAKLKLVEEWEGEGSVEDVAGQEATPEIIAAHEAQS